MGELGNRPFRKLIPYARIMIEPRPRPFPDRDLDLASSVVAFLQFIQTTSINKVAGLTEQQASATPIPTSPAVSLLGLLKHMTAVQRQHIQIHIGGSDLPSLWRADDTDFDFRLGPDDTVESVVAAFDAECQRSAETLAGLDPERAIVAYGDPNRAGRLLVDVVQECARHLGHMDIVRELVDGAKGE
jgi:hypothetical protein